MIFAPLDLGIELTDADRAVIAAADELDAILRTATARSALLVVCLAAWASVYFPYAPLTTLDHSAPVL